jgi:DMSO/TMAO reductase YedYZ molybdopterin-dependent catalytic subunit
MRSRDDARFAVAGVVAAGGGLALSELLSGFAHLRVSPLEAVAESIIALTPGSIDEFVISHLGHGDKPLVIATTLIGVAILSAIAGLVSRTSKLAGEGIFVFMGAAVVAAVHDRLPSGTTTYLPALLGVLVAMLLLSILVDRAQAATAEALQARHVPPAQQAISRRSFLQLAGVIAVGAVAVGTFGRVLAHGREKVEAARAALVGRFGRTPAPAGVDLGIDGVATWVTPVDDFYRIDTALAVPLVVPSEWRLRIHGMVDKELTLTYDDLMRRGLTEDWLTLCCVSNPVGGGLIGNAYWSGVLIKPILEEAGPHPDADAVLSRSADGWTAGTPLPALLDGRNAMFAMAMNGEPLTPEHGFPVRMLVPGLYGYVSATKWVVDLQVTRFDDFSAFWTERGWSPQGPIKTESRIDTPRNGASLSAGRVMVAGVAWAQHRGIQQVEVQVDGGAWHPCRLAADPTIDSWRQWVYEWPATSGDHAIAVRATDDTGATQTSRRAGVIPDGASGYHTIHVSVS